MKPLKPRDKVTQRMTRDGLTLDNQTTGESVNVSSREAEQSRWNWSVSWRQGQQGPGRR